MSRRPSRAAAIRPDLRDELLQKAHTLWRASCAALAGLKPEGEDYRAAQELNRALAAFAKRVSGGTADFGAMLSSTSYLPRQAWLEGHGDFESAVDEAIAVCGGDPRTAIRSLLVLTEFLEREAEGG